ncbi:hypothetical protein NKH37_15755 [Mesorhizobium sp. M1217]|uniref:hypothetical protein n=1 Tax=Mesorhizobium sp. M1217 TaxID=2957070 RepID=UPI00333D524F
MSDEPKENRRSGSESDAAADQKTSVGGKYSSSSRKARRSGRKIIAGKCVIAEQRSEGGFWDKALLRMREIEQVVQMRFGKLIPEEIDADPFILIVAHAANALKRPSDLKSVLAGWCARFAPHLMPDFDHVFEPVRMRIEGRRYNLSDTDAGRLVRLTWQERSALEIRTMNSADISIEEQRDRVAAKARVDDIERKRQARRQEGSDDRESYLAKVSTGKPWEAEGISRSYYYERKKRERTGPADPAHNAERTGSAEGARTGSAVTRDMDTYPFGSPDAPVHSTVASAIIDEIVQAVGGGSPPTSSSPPISYGTIKNGEVEFVTTAGSHGLPASIEAPRSSVSETGRRRVSR